MIIPYKNHHIFAFSDTHGMHTNLNIPQEADILICAGDGVNDFDDQELTQFLSWYAAQPAKLRIFIAGNHELQFDLYPQEALAFIPKKITFLENSGINYDGISFYSIAARPWLHQAIQIPQEIDFLITHGPAQNTLDEGTGCSLLKDAIVKYKPSNHVFGHIHSCGNQLENNEWTRSYNVSCFNQLHENY